MTLSEAIRLGAMNRPQAFSMLFDPRNGGTCALGAAMDAIGPDIARHWFTGHSVSMAAWPWLYELMVKNPALDRRRAKQRLNIVIVDLNNSHKWTREAIADWVATIEPAEQSQAVERTSTPDAVDGVAASESQAVHARV